MNLPTLQTLIRSMTKNESRAFSKMVDLKERKNNYIQLFDYLVKVKTIDFGALENQYGKHGLEAARKYLTKLIMKAIRDADYEKSIENKLIDLLKDAQILHRKGFTETSFELLNKIKETALKNESYPYYLLAARLELRYLGATQFVGIDEFELIKKQKNISEIFDHEVQFYRHTSLHEVLQNRYWRNGIVYNAREKAKLNDLLLEEFNILNNRNYRSFKSQAMHLNFQSVYFLMIGEHEESLKLFYELNSLFRKNETFWTDSPDYYIAVLDGILTDLFAMGRYTEMEFFLDQLNEVPETSEDLILQKQVLKNYYRLSILNQEGLYAEGILIINSATIVINSVVNNPSTSPQAQLSLMVALTYFNNKQFKECSKLLNSILNLPDSNIPDNIYNQLRMIYLMTQCELGNFDYLPYQTRSFERKLTAGKQEAPIEKVFIAVIKQLYANPGAYLKNGAMFLDKLNILAQIPYYAQVIRKLKLVSWIENKRKPLAGKPSFSKNN
jgi:hypothetical protein